MRNAIVFLITACMLSGMKCKANTLFDGGLPDDLGGWSLDSFIEANPFVLGQTDVLNGIQFWEFQDVSYGNVAPISIAWVIYANNGIPIGGYPAPGTTLASLLHLK